VSAPSKLAPALRSEEKGGRALKRERVRTCSARRRADAPSAGPSVAPLLPAPRLPSTRPHTPCTLFKMGSHSDYRDMREHETREHETREHVFRDRDARDRDARDRDARDRDARDARKAAKKERKRKKHGKKHKSHKRSRSSSSSPSGRSRSRSPKRQRPSSPPRRERRWLPLSCRACVAAAPRLRAAAPARAARRAEAMLTAFGAPARTHGASRRRRLRWISSSAS